MTLWGLNFPSECISDECGSFRGCLFLGVFPLPLLFPLTLCLFSPRLAKKFSTARLGTARLSEARGCLNHRGIHHFVTVLPPRLGHRGNERDSERGKGKRESREREQEKRQPNCVTAICQSPAPLNWPRVCPPTRSHEATGEALPAFFFFFFFWHLAEV